MPSDQGLPEPVGTISKTAFLRQVAKDTMLMLKVGLGNILMA